MIGQYAFPIAVCIWLLYERKGVMKELQTHVQANTAATIELVTLIREEIKRK